MSRQSSFFLVLFLLLITTTPAIKAHYNLIYPTPYQVIHCNLPACPGACPPIWTGGPAKAQNMPATTKTIWKRGETLQIRWHKNNHHGGFIRASLVPVRYMFDKEWHERTAFQWGCFAQGRKKCKMPMNPSSDVHRVLRTCGTDSTGSTFGTVLKIPQVFPDGDYVYAQLWYGGTNWTPEGPEMFPDFKTCAFVKIQGGKPLKDEYIPTFESGVRYRTGIDGGICSSYATKVGECDGLKCLNATVKFSKPDEFLDGGHPPAIKLEELNGTSIMEDPEWIVDERKSRSMNDKVTQCAAAHAGCADGEKLMCLACAWKQCGVAKCGMCKSMRRFCRREMRWKRIPTGWSSNMLKCEALHRTCTRGKDERLKRSACFLCQSKLGCAKGCHGNGWCSTNAAQCRAVPRES